MLFEKSKNEIEQVYRPFTLIEKFECGDHVYLSYNKSLSRWKQGTPREIVIKKSKDKYVVLNGAKKEDFITKKKRMSLPKTSRLSYKRVKTTNRNNKWSTESTGVDETLVLYESYLLGDKGLLIPREVRVPVVDYYDEKKMRITMWDYTNYNGGNEFKLGRSNKLYIIINEFGCIESITNSDKHEDMRREIDSLCSEDKKPELDYIPTKELFLYADEKGNIVCNNKSDIYEVVTTKEMHDAKECKIQLSSYIEDADKKNESVKDVYYFETDDGIKWRDSSKYSIKCRHMLGIYGWIDELK